MSEKLNLFQRINKVREAINYIQKDKAVSTGGGSYKAVTHDAVTGILREHLNRFGIVCFPFLVSSSSLPKEDGAKQFRYEATYDFSFVNIDTPDEKIVIRIEAHAMDNADKAPGKALSYAKKYALLKLFEIETGEDEESRYDSKSMSNDELAHHLDAIKECDNEPDLKAAYEAAYREAKSYDDKNAMGVIIKAKDAQKVAMKKMVEGQA